MNIHLKAYLKTVWIVTIWSNLLDPLKSAFWRIFGIWKVVIVNTMVGSSHSFVLFSDFTKLHRSTTANNETENTFVLIFIDPFYTVSISNKIKIPSKIDNHFFSPKKKKLFLSSVLAENIFFIGQPKSILDKCYETCGSLTILNGIRLQLFSIHSPCIDGRNIERNTYVRKHIVPAA